MNKKNKKLNAFISLLLVLLLLPALVWAGGEQTTKKPVRIAYLQNDIHHLAFWVAQDTGMFGPKGSTVNVAGIFRAGPEIMSAFAAGALDMAYVGEAPTTTAVANGSADVVVISQVNTEGSALVIASSGKNSIATLGDLKGKTVAVPGLSTVQDFLLKQALRKQGVNLENVNFIVIKPPEMINVLRNGDVDAFIAWEPYPAKAQTMGVGRNLATSKELWPGHPCCVLVADAKFLAEHPEQVKAVLHAHVQATDYIHQHPQQAAEIGVKYTGMDKTTIEQAMQTVNYTYTLSIDGERQYVEFLSELGYIPKVDADQFVNKLINQELLQGEAR